MYYPRSARSASRLSYDIGVHRERIAVVREMSAGMIGKVTIGLTAGKQNSYREVSGGS